MNILLLIPLAGILLGAPRTPAGPPTASPEAIRARDAVADIVLLQSLIPLKLTAEQIDRLLPTMKAAQEDYLKLVRRDDDALKALEPTLTRMRAEAIEGKLPSAEDEKKITDANKAAEARAAEARKKATLDLLAQTLAVFNDDQKAEVQRQSDALYGGKRVPRAFVNNPSKAPKDQVEALALSAYIERVLLIDRTIALLEKMRAAASAP